MTIVAEVLDSVYGKPAAGIRVRMMQAAGNQWETIAVAETTDDGRIDAWGRTPLRSGLYRIIVDTDSYFAGLGAMAAYPDICLTFRKPEQCGAIHVHIMLAPYSCATSFCYTES